MGWAKATIFWQARHRQPSFPMLLGLSARKVRYCGGAGAAGAQFHAPHRCPPHHVLSLAAVPTFALFPIFWMVSTSLKPLGEWAAMPQPWVPRSFAARSATVMTRLPAPRQRRIVRYDGRHAL